MYRLNLFVVTKLNVVFSYVSDVIEYQGWASVLFKRMFRSLRSFPFFIKEQNVLCVHGEVQVLFIIQE